MDLYAAIKNRRSHRLYRSEPVPREVLERVMEAALWAPSGTNLQPWDLTVLTGKDRDDFVALASLAWEDIAPKLRKLFDEEKVVFLKQFFKNLGGAPVV
ncbi:MAG: nitroreductase family protein, partial [Deltaproteobacteria bacterium]|nr:nitroreductase family protein [Deltaproteobacteria bacterium]